jgi:DNA-binding Lrp family transcriptional regulator
MRKIEWKLLSELMKNSRRSDRELAKAINSSQPTVTRTRRKLETQGYIKEYTMLPDFRKIGYELMALTFLKGKSSTTLKDLEEIRDKAKDLMEKSPTSSVLIDVGVGLGYGGVIISFHTSYESYLELRGWIDQFEIVDRTNIKSFLISLGKTFYKPLTFQTLAKHVSTFAEK